jgi:prepilin-type N-terminal cleavage/methylation domain-containing protein
MFLRRVRQSNRSLLNLPLRNTRAGFPLMELLIVIAIILVILTIATPQYNKILMSAREQWRFAHSLQELGPPVNGVSACPGASELIDRELAAGKRGGYRFTVQRTEGGYSIDAVPETHKTTGSKTFYSDLSMAVHERAGPEPATVNDLLVGEAAP